MKLYLHTTKGRFDAGKWAHECTTCDWTTPWHGADERSHYAHQAADHTITMSAHVREERYAEMQRSGERLHFTARQGR